MVLDEPTNDLDIETLDLLQELLSDYAGTILIVSHDRDFLDRVATSVIAAEGNGAGSNIQAAIPIWSRNAATDWRVRWPRRREKAERPDKPPADRAAPRRKLGFNERRALEALPERIEANSR